jgi:hypothetical protein
MRTGRGEMNEKLDISVKKVAASLVILVALWALFLRGVTVEVRNVSDEPMRAVVVHVTGGSYALGDLLPGDSRQVAVSPGGESHVELEFQGHPRLVVGCYFEPGYSGTITAEVTPLKVVSVNSSIQPW